MDGTTDRNPAKLSIHRGRLPQHGKYPPPFKNGTAAHAAWYRSVQRQAKLHMHIPWPEFYAKAKEDAYKNPPKQREYKRHRALFGGANSPGYRAWYYRTMQACKAAGPNTNWPEFFAKARQAEMVRQGLLDKPPNVVPFNPNRAQSLAFVPPSPAMTPQDGRLMFDFSVDNADDREWR